MSVRYRIASWIMSDRAIAAAVVMALTVFFLIGMRHVDLRTIFSDLLPKDHPFVQTYKAHSNFGNPLTVSIMVKRKSGDIYNAATLDKVWQLTRDIDLTPGVDH